MNSGYLKELIPCCGPRIHYCVIRLEIVLSTLVSPTLRTESQPVVYSFYEKKRVVSRTHLKKTNYSASGVGFPRQAQAWQALVRVHGEPESDRVAYRYPA